jgi:hypothetical protein
VSAHFTADHRLDRGADDRRALDTGASTPARSGPRWHPLVIRTSGAATQGVYGLILATTVIAVSRETASSPDAGRTAATVLVVAVVFWLAHAYASLLGMALSQERGLTRGDVAEALRENWSLVEVTVPLVLMLALGAIGVISDRSALVAAAVIALVELTAAGGYAARRRDASPLGTIFSAAIALALGAMVVLLKALIH